MKQQNQDELLAVLERLRAALQDVQNEYTRLVYALNGKEPSVARTRSLLSSPAALKGEKPASLSFPDGRTKQTYTWRKLVSAVLEDCGSIPECRDRLVAVKNIVAGRKRVVLSDDPSVMNVPLKISDGLYFEGFFDTEFLFKQLRYVLDLAGYDYSEITFQLRERKHEQTEEQESVGEPEEESGPTMSM
ncbi:hypothetical protein [Acutalibacter muris]|uniref:hypothetical protein n=1 Tax=Acutalibacter muris TaxID=1796620 RepID=UPI0020CC563C|nr:hypothetical protein [Acutalibacter muris]